ncbi:MAG: Haloacid dehalogenase domain protein hydrolase [Fibrobacteres bacterium]|nr:Haloacid dehalogenase domain protein hydrolase [Fibrobacterota bacterium]
MDAFRPEFIFLDFDGVIMDSMALKLDSYCHAFEGMGFGRESIRKLQLASAGLSRQKTIPLMYEALSGSPMPEGLYAQALGRFSEHDDASRGKMVLKNGAGEFLAAAREARLPLAIVTGTPQEVIEKTVAHFGLGPYFARVCGSPGTKPQHLERLLGEFSLRAERCLYAGDAIKDQEAAVGLDIPFVGVNNGDDPFRPEGLMMEIKGLDALLPFLRHP